MGKMIQNQLLKFVINSPHKKLIKIFNSMCPDIILANRRIARLNILEKYDTHSIKTKTGIIMTGTPSGRNKAKYFSLCKQIPTKLVPIKNAKEKYSVKIRWLVIVILYGTIPKILLKKINKNTAYTSKIKECFLTDSDPNKTFLAILKTIIFTISNLLLKKILFFLLIKNIGTKQQTKTVFANVVHDRGESLINKNPNDIVSMYVAKKPICISIKNCSNGSKTFILEITGFEPISCPCKGQILAN